LSRMSRTRAAYRIQENIIYEDTAPELAFDALAKKLDILVEGHLKLILIDGWHVKPDRWIVHTDVVVEIDGPYHDTPIQKRKMEWRDSVLTSRGLRVFHVPSELLIAQGVRDSKKWWPWVALALTEFLFSKKKVERLIASPPANM
jgi:hypothetical protein